MSRVVPIGVGLRPVDVAVAVYAIVSGAVVAIGAPDLAAWPWLLAARGALLAGIVALARIHLRTAAASGVIPAASGIVQALYPLLVCPLFFWETPRLAGALWEGREWWFEATLAGWDRALFGGPSVPAAFGLPELAGEVLWLFYFTYYPLVVAGIALAWRGRRGEGGLLPGAGYEPVLTAAVLGFLGAYALFPLLPARAPIHVVGGTPGATGGIFGWAVGWVQGWGGVTGSAFPSAHVSAAWAIVVALAPDRPRAAAVLGVVAVGMTAACVYTPYHWAADVVAGLALGLVAGVIGRRLGVSRSRAGSARAPRGTDPSRGSAGASPGRA